MYTFNIRDCKYDFASDNINIIVLIYDVSGSMDSHITAMRKANDAFYNDFSKFEERGSIAIAKATFDNYFWMSSFRNPLEFDTSYYAEGGTRMYYSIVEAANNTIEYYNEIVKRLNVRPRITFLVFSDGQDNSSTSRNAREAIKKLNSLDATTVFVAFREAIAEKTGEKLGFTCTREITTVKELISCLGGELSKSCKEQSKSAFSLKSNFFSQANNAEDDDTLEEQPIVDDDFFNV